MGWCRVRIRLVFDEFMFRVTLVISVPPITGRHPYYLSFPNIQRTCTRPVGVVVWPVNRPVFLAFKSRSCDWECKGKQKFWTGKRKRRIFIFSSGRFSIRFRPLSKRGAKVRSFLQEPRQKTNFFHTGLFVRLRSIWGCKGTGNFEMVKGEMKNTFDELGVGK